MNITTNENITLDYVYAESNNITYNFLDGPEVTITGNKQANYTIHFKNGKTGELLSVGKITNNQVCRSLLKFYIEWELDIYQDDIFYSSFRLNLQDKKVLLVFDSSALGDTLAWIPYIKEFKSKHNCDLYVSTYYNFLFREVYSDITFIEPDFARNNYYAVYTLGVFIENETVNIFKNPNDYRNVPLQQIATDILGLEYKEIKGTVIMNDLPNDYNSNRIVISPQSTKQSKYWNNDNGWQELVNYLKDKYYEVICIGNKPNNENDNKIPEGVTFIEKISIPEIIPLLKSSRLFIGLGSGLSWLSWTLNVPTVVISGFSYSYTEMQDCIRITAPSDSCSGCFNRHIYDRNKWDWCPDFENTVRQFECTKNISANNVIDKIIKLI